MSDIGLGEFLERQERSKAKHFNKLGAWEQYKNKNMTERFKPDERNPDKRAYFQSGVNRQKIMREKALNKDLRRFFK